MALNLNFKPANAATVAMHVFKNPSPNPNNLNRQTVLQTAYHVSPITKFQNKKFEFSSSVKIETPYQNKSCDVSPLNVLAQPQRIYDRTPVIVGQSNKSAFSKFMPQTVVIPACKISASSETEKHEDD